ncbi:MAG TPA: SDR family oxidoreductase [Candidatus Acidoferrales bacterium]|jgi:2-keto-3-deoxy-L-fuconate dehydrogenase|nr:SDR family oxidoreductase [Candidatus Acidoferrales bacterium]
MLKGSIVFSLKNKTALVTGAASGIGAAIAETFIQAGATVWIADRNENDGIAVAQRLGGRFIQIDVADEAVCARVAQAVGALDILANVAGIGHVGTLLGTTAADLDKLYAVNVRGIFNGCKAFVPAMLERKSGSIINMASIGGIVAVRERLAYTTTKFAVVGLTKALALDHSHTGVRFNCICPGRVETPFVMARLKEYPDPQAAYRDMASTQLNGRMAKPDEIAAAALYLAADESAMVTGSTMMIDGGWSAGK